MSDRRPVSTAERTEPTNPAEQPILARQMAAYINALDVCVGRTITEVGCGRGAGTAMLAEVAQTVIAVDWDAACLERNRAERTDDVVTFVVAEVPPLPPVALRADVVVCFQMIEHLRDPVPLLQALHDAVLPGGAVLLSTPNAAESLSPNPYHLHEFEGPELQAVLERIFDRVTMYSVLGDEVFQRYWAANKAYVQRVMRLDPLGLNRYIPANMKRWLFDTASRVMRARLQADTSTHCATIGPENFHFKEGLHPGALDFYAVCLRAKA